MPGSPLVLPSSPLSVLLQLGHGPDRRARHDTTAQTPTTGRRDMTNIFISLNQNIFRFYINIFLKEYFYETNNFPVGNIN